MLPNFLIIGAMKCGTTSLAYYLNQHKDIYVAPEKDIYFFSDDELFNKGIHWYESFFKNTDKYVALGEATDDYSKQWRNSNTVKRIYKIIPSVKIIYIVRDPLRQIESAYMHLVANSYERLTFNQAIYHSSFNYIETADYLMQLNAYKEFFPESSILVLFLEDMLLNTKNVLASCFNFLGCSSTECIYTDNALNVSLEKSYDRKFTYLFRKQRIIEKVAQALPYFIKSPLKHVFTKKRVSRPLWEPVVRREVINALKANSEEFLLMYGKDKNYWQF